MPAWASVEGLRYEFVNLDWAYSNFPTR